MEPIFAVAFLAAVIISTTLFVILISHYRKFDKNDTRKVPDKRERSAVFRSKIPTGTSVVT
ncbi:MAG: hypothetical protein EOO06_19455 [Chitinophagaceae bacterium]|nr:MAG: hypothetical protein EOO06_19455 [Chitinophagaceae bacterium]